MPVKARQIMSTKSTYIKELLILSSSFNSRFSSLPCFIGKTPQPEQDRYWYLTVRCRSPR
jgi:hypothetical protein